MPCDLWMTGFLRIVKHKVTLHTSEVIHRALLRQFILTKVIISGGVYHTSIIGGKRLVTYPTVLRVTLVIAYNQWVQITVHIDPVHVCLVVRHVERGG